MGGTGLAQQASGRSKQILEKLAFPGIPDFGRSPPDISDREQIECREVSLGLDGACKSSDDLRV